MERLFKKYPLSSGLFREAFDSFNCGHARVRFQVYLESQSKEE